MTRIIAIASQKGGVGKTTTVINLAAALVELGREVLLVDLDPQASLSISLAVNPAQASLSLFAALQRAHAGEKPDTRHAVVITDSGLPLIPASIELSQAEVDLPRDGTGLSLLKDCLKPLVRTFDYILLDCPPSLSILTGLALAAAHEVIIPLQTDYLALRGVELLLTTLEKVRQRVNRKLKVTGILLTLADFRTAHTAEVVQAARARFSANYRVFQTIIPMNVRLKEAPLTGRSVLAYAPNSSGSEAYRALAQEVEATE